MAPWLESADLSIATEATLVAAVDEALANGYCALDTETGPRFGVSYSGLDTRDYDGKWECTRSKLVGIALAPSTNKALYVPCQHIEGNLSYEVVSVQMKRLGDAIKAGSLVVMFWNAAFDMRMLERLLGLKQWPEGSYVDGMILDALIRPWSFKHDLKSTSAKVLGREMMEFEAPIVKVEVPIFSDHPLIYTRPNKSMDFGARTPDLEVARYAAADAMNTLQLCVNMMQKDLDKDVVGIAALEHEFLQAVRDMQSACIGYDRAHAIELTNQINGEAQSLMAELNKYGIKRTSYFKDVLAGLAPLGFTGESTDKKTLRGLKPGSELYDVAQLVMKHRRATKLLSSYLVPLLMADSPNELQGGWKAMGAKSGRMSAGPLKGRKKTDQFVWSTWLPQGQPKDDQFRKLYTSRPGFLLLKADFSAEEYRCCAALAGEESWIRTFNSDDPDVHAATGRVLHLDYDDVEEKIRKQWRQESKTVNFLIIYGGSAQALADLLGWPIERAQAVMDDFYARAPKLRAFQLSCIEQAKQWGKVRTYFGRPISVRGDSTVATKLGEDDETSVHAAPNYVIQGTCGDILKKAVNQFRAEQSGLFERGDVKIVNLVHDEILVEVREDLVHNVWPSLKHSMESQCPSEWPLRLTVDGNYGRTWVGELGVLD